MTEKCTRPLQFMLRPSERAALEKRANGRPVAAYIRERLGLEPVSPGRRWPEDPTQRQWRKTT